MSNVIHDLPANFFDEANLLDANFGFGLQDTNIPTSKTFTEKYAAKKGDYNFLPIGTPSASHPQAVLYEESNFQDIGGGLMTFVRKYAQIPEPHEELITAPIRAGRIFGLEGSGYTSNFIGGDLNDGSQFLFVNGSRDFVNVRASATYDIPCIKKTSYYLRKDGDEGSSVLMDNSSEIMIVKDETLVQGGQIQKFSWYNQTVVFFTRSYRGAKFDRDTIFRKENGGRYLGNIFMIHEYRLLNDTPTNFGAILSDSQIQIA